MSLLLPKRRFASLSVKDLLDAREAYHTHLLHLENVIATAIELMRGEIQGLFYRYRSTGGQDQLADLLTGQLAARVATATKLARLLERNEDRISYEDDILGERAEKTDDFIPLADVSDLVWKAGGQSVRGTEGPNHFADMDQPSAAFGGKNLLELSEDPAFLDPEKWNEFYESLDIPMRHRGLLPFRVWQLFDAMVAALQNDSLAGYIGAAGVLAHYVGDACQPLHISMLHDGEPNGRGQGVHSAYETKMLNRFAADLNARIDAPITASPPATKRIRNGKEAAEALLGLMARSIRAIPPQTMIDVFEDNRRRVAELWTAFGDKTAARLVDGATVLASLWRGAWEAAGGEDAFNQNQLRAIPLSRLSDLYLDKTWVPSVTIARMRIVGGQLEVDAS